MKNKEKIGEYNMFRCLLCGTSLHWHSDFNIDEVFGEDEDGVVGIYSCPKCNLDYEIGTYSDYKEMKVIIIPNEDDYE